ncbi:hypothetical protein ABK040_015312 [Willaertia magna]
MSQKPFDCNFKLVLVGDSGTGKSSILMQFTEDEFKEHISPTIGVDFKVKFIEAKKKRVKLTIFDTAGQERFRTLTSSYYRNAHAVILVYDVTRKETFDNIQNWLKECNLYATYEDCVKLLVGNKIDLKEKREVSEQQGDTFARQNNMLYIETSAKTREGIDQAFEEVAHQILDNDKLNETGGSGQQTNKSSSSVSQSGNIDISSSGESGEPQSSTGCCW